MKTSNIYIILLFALFLSGCNSLTSNPELSDKVYLDFSQESEKLKKECESTAKELEALSFKLQEKSLGFADRSLTKKDIQKAKNSLQKLSQKLLYYEYAKDSRRIFIKKLAIKAYKDGEPLPKDSFSYYFQLKKAQGVESTWTRGIASSPVSSKK